MCNCLREAAKKILMAVPLRPFINGKPYNPPPLLMAMPLRKELFLRLPFRNYTIAAGRTDKENHRRALQYITHWLLQKNNTTYILWLYVCRQDVVLKYPRSL